jgi:hypothetical protein
VWTEARFHRHLGEAFRGAATAVMLADHRRLWTRMSKPGHQLLRRDAGSRRQGAGRVPQVVEPQVLYVSCGEGRQPDAASEVVALRAVAPLRSRTHRPPLSRRRSPAAAGGLRRGGVRVAPLERPVPGPYERGAEICDGDVPEDGEFRVDPEEDGKAPRGAIGESAADPASRPSPRQRFRSGTCSPRAPGQDFCGGVVVGTGVDPVTSRFSGARSAN